MEPIFEPNFHPSSYAYRPDRSCQMVVAKAEMFINRYGLRHVVDMDLSKCFDRLDHELILQGVNRKISDGRVLKLIKQFLKAGVVRDGAWEETKIGSPQGSVISLLLCNIYLDAFDQAMKERGIRIVRYADDILIFAWTPRQARRYRDAAVKIFQGDLKLTVNREKMHLTDIEHGVAFLGFVIRETRVSIHLKRIPRFKDRVRQLTPRNHGKNVEQQIQELNRFLRGWLNYFRIADCKTFVRQVMTWIRRRLRMKQMREWKSWKALHRALRRNGHREEHLKISMSRWLNSRSPLVHMAIPNSWFDQQGLYNMARYEVGVLSHYAG